MFGSRSSRSKSSCPHPGEFPGILGGYLFGIWLGFA